MKTILSGIQPSNRITLGNYLGALRQWVPLQDENECLFFSGNLHAITVRQDPKTLYQTTLRALATYLGVGIDPERALLFVQSDVPEHCELAWVLGCETRMGELNRMTQFKDKSSKQESVSSGLFTYPVLMAADILLYQTHLVPVGDDQKQHLELTRDIAIRMNDTYGKLFTVPEPFIPKLSARVMSLQNPMSKMSKSDPDPNGSIFLDDSDDQIQKKFKRAVTDSGSEITDTPEKPGVRNLIWIQAALLGESPEKVVERYQGKQYGHLKLETAACVIETLRPIREKIDTFMADQPYLESILKKGAARAREKAQRTLDSVYKAIGVRAK